MRTKLLSSFPEQFSVTSIRTALTCIRNKLCVIKVRDQGVQGFCDFHQHSLMQGKRAPAPPAAHRGPQTLGTSAVKADEVMTWVWPIRAQILLATEIGSDLDTQHESSQSASTPELMGLSGKKSTFCISLKRSCTILWTLCRETRVKQASHRLSNSICSLPFYRIEQSASHLCECQVPCTCPMIRSSDRVLSELFLIMSL